MKRKKLLYYFLPLLIVAINFFILSPTVSRAQMLGQKRISGMDRYSTAVEISKFNFQSSKIAILATGEDFPDALCAAPLAKKLDAPVLLTAKDDLSCSVLDELKRLNVKEIYIIGGNSAINQKVQEQLEQQNIVCTRIQGEDRYETAVKIAEKMGLCSEIVVATGNNYPDALSISSFAAFKGIPIILCDKNSIPASVKKILMDIDISKSYLIGGESVISQNVLTEFSNCERIYGNDRYETNVAILNRFSNEFKFDTVYMATGEDFPDALAGSVLASKTLSPIILVCENMNSMKVGSCIRNISSSIMNIRILGGERAVSTSSLNSIFNYYTLIDQGKYEYTDIIKVTNNGSSNVENIALEVNIGTLNSSPYQTNENITISGIGASIHTDINGNKKALINLASLENKHTAEYKIVRSFIGAGIKYNVDLSKTLGDYSLFNNFELYVSPVEKIESSDSQIIDKAQSITKDEINPYFKAKKIFDYVNTNIIYDDSQMYSNKGAKSALINGRGVCEDFADLFTALTRSVGVPARTVCGYLSIDEDVGQQVDISGNRHAWAEFYLPEYGWIAVDPTFMKFEDGIRVPEYECFANINEPGHFIADYDSNEKYSLEYSYRENTTPDIDMKTEEYIKRIQ